MSVVAPVKLNPLDLAIDRLIEEGSSAVKTMVRNAFN